MPAVFDNAAAAASAAAVTTITTPSFTIAGTDRAACIGLGWDDGTAVTGVSASCGGVSGSEVTGTSVVNYMRGVLYSVIAPATGAQTATASWTTARLAGIGVVTATGVDQTTPMNNGTSAFGTGVPSRTITSTSGDLTTDCVAEQDIPSVPTQTERYNQVSGIGIAGSTGPGTGTTTHAWATSPAEWAHMGANFVQVAAGGPARIIGGGLIPQTVS